jgi:hypothetical protein
VAKRRNLVLFGLSAALVLAGGGACAAHQVINSSMAGLCGAADLGRLREIRGEITKNQSAGSIDNYECEDSSDEPFVGAQAAKDFDCDQMTRDFEHKLGTSLHRPGEEGAPDSTGPYVDADGFRIYFFCLRGEVELTELQLSLQ